MSLEATTGKRSFDSSSANEDSLFRKPRTTSNDQTSKPSEQTATSLRLSHNRRLLWCLTVAALPALSSMLHYPFINTSALRNPEAPSLLSIVVVIPVPTLPFMVIDLNSYIFMNILIQAQFKILISLFISYNLVYEFEKSVISTVHQKTYLMKNCWHNLCGV